LRRFAILCEHRIAGSTHWDQAGLVLLVIFGVVIVTEVATSWVRGRII
jgi:ABC-type phosphate/phosphonate transport system permease subunit